MFKNYFKIAFRSLVKNRFSSLINIGGLAVGMTVAMLIALCMYDELSFNQYHKNSNRISLVVRQVTLNTGQAAVANVAKSFRTE